MTVFTAKRLSAERKGMTYKVKLPVFEGPFDLLLNLIAKHKVDIYEVPLAQITEEYLAYLEKMQQLDLEITSEFIVVAATLLVIKAAGLVPAPTEEEVETVDPEAEKQLLLARLAEYRKFKLAAAVLSARYKVEALYYPRLSGYEPQFSQVMPDIFISIPVENLTKIMHQLWQRHKMHLLDSGHIAPVFVSVESQIGRVLALLTQQPRATLSQLAGNKSLVIATFLALLELCRRGLIKLRQTEAFSEIEILKKDGA